MRAEEMMIRSEIRQMLNEAGLNRESLREIVQDAINDIVEKKIDEAVHKYGGLDGRISKELGEKLRYTVQDEVKEAIRNRIKYVGLRVTVDIPEPEKENDNGAMA